MSAKLRFAAAAIVGARCAASSDGSPVTTHSATSQPDAYLKVRDMVSPACPAATGPSGLSSLIEYYPQQAFECDLRAATTERPGSDSEETGH